MKLVGINSKKVIKLKGISRVFTSPTNGQTKTNMTFAFDAADGWSGTYQHGKVRITEIGYTIPEIYEACND